MSTTNFKVSLGLAIMSDTVYSASNTHRLINHQDKEAIANACSSANRDTLSFLPVLGSGEAILMGVDFPMPVMLKVEIPLIKPKSDTPLF